MRIALKIIGGIFACALSAISVCFFSEKVVDGACEAYDSVHTKFAKTPVITPDPEPTKEAE